jgi:XTP/dITP diphosphohydrolase
MSTLVIATKNPGKAREFQEMLALKGIEVKTLADFAPIEITEDGQSFEENALKKAEATVAALNLPVIADDSGLMVDALNGEPGIYSARYAGDHDDFANNQKLLENLAGIPDEKRTAHFHTTIIGLKPNGAKVVANGHVNGHILRKLTGTHGFGYDPLFFVDELGEAMGNLTDEQKNAISHRGRALKELMINFEEWWEA